MGMSAWTSYVCSSELLDRAGRRTLLLGRHGGDAARHDLAALRNEALQQARVLVVDLRRLRPGERAALAATEEGATATAAADDLDAHSAPPSLAVAPPASASRGRRSRPPSRSRPTSRPPRRTPRSRSPRPPAPPPPSRPCRVCLTVGG